MIEFSRILNILRRYPLLEEINICQKYSYKIMNPTGININSITNPRPWELETFLLLSIKADPHWGKNDFRGKNEKIFFKIINEIKDHKHPFWEQIEFNDFSDENFNFIMISNGNVQFDIQEYFLYKMYRFNYFFNFHNKNIDMQENFYDKFGTDYNRFLELGMLIWIFNSPDIPYSKKLYDDLIYQIIIKYKDVIEFLTLSPEKYRSNLNKITSDINDYLYCLRPSYTYPFLEINHNIYLPLPHLICRAVTSSLLYRMTDNNTPLLEIFGKEVLENYVYKILNDNTTFDEVMPEQKYYVHGDEKKSADVLTRTGNQYIFFESKSIVPKIDFQIFSKESANDYYERCADAIVQVYKNIRNDFPGNFNPFYASENIFLENVWGIIIIRENIKLSYNIAHDKAASALCIKTNSNDYSWLKSHIFICSLSEIENFCFANEKFTDHIIKKTDKIQTHEFSILDIKGKKLTKNVEIFKNSLLDSVKDIKDQIFAQYQNAKEY